MVRSRDLCPEIRVGPEGVRCRVVVATHPVPLRTTEFAVALPPQSEQTATSPASSAPASGYGPPTTATTFKTGRFTGADFPHEGDGTLRCPAGQSLTTHEWRRARRWQPTRGQWGQPSQLSSLCTARALPVEWQRHRKAGARFSLLLYPLPVGSAPLRLRVIGVGGFIFAPASACCTTNGWRSPCRRPYLPSHATQRASCPVRSGPILACRGKHGWRAMPGLRLLTGPPSSRSRVPETFATFLGLPTA